MLNILCRNSFFVFKFSPLVFTSWSSFENIIYVEIQAPQPTCLMTTGELLLAKATRKKEHQNKNKEEKYQAATDEHKFPPHYNFCLWNTHSYE